MEIQKRTECTHPLLENDKKVANQGRREEESSQSREDVKKKEKKTINKRDICYVTRLVQYFSSIISKSRVHIRYLPSD